MMLQRPELLRLVAESGDSHLKCCLGIMLIDGDSVDIDVRQQGMEVLRQSAAEGCLEAQYEYGRRSVAERPAEGSNYLKQAADKGHLGAARLYASLLLVGSILPADFSSAIPYYLEGMHHGDLACSAITASYFCCGRLTKVDSLYSIPGRQSLDKALTAFWAILPVDWANADTMMTDSDADDILTAVADLKTAADAGKPDAQLLFAFCLVHGFGTPASRRDGFEYLLSAANQRHTRALVELARFYGAGLLEAPVTHIDAARYFIAAAELNDLATSRRMLEDLGTLLTEWSLVRELLTTVSSKRLPPTSRWVVAKLGRRQQNRAMSQIICRFRELCADLTGLSLWLDGWCHENGFEVELDLSRAAELYRQSADAGLSLGHYDYSLFLCQGIGVHKDLPEAIRHLKEAAKHGSRGALCTRDRLGVCR
jgi:TPR repeat protein